MDIFAIKPDAYRSAVFTEAANRRGVLPIVIEKDFWVCWTLKRLFDNPRIAPHLTFKGGTSLSKAYGLIERFSEDIDITISRQAPFLVDGKDPMEDAISGKERQRRIDTLKENAQQFVAVIILNALNESVEHALGRQDVWQIILDPHDPDKQTIIFQYPKTATESGYLKPQIKLEFGARGETEPRNAITITPYAAEDFPDQFKQRTCTLATLTVVRSYWEKVTILHALCHGSKMRARMSRHFYDTFMMDQRGITQQALTEIPLLTQVVRNKTLFFRDPKASYETAMIGGLRLVPEGSILKDLKRDYIDMDEMFMAKSPNFDAILKALSLLEKRLNEA